MRGRDYLFVATRWLLKAAALISLILAGLVLIALGALIVVALHPEFDIPPLLEGAVRAQAFRAGAIAIAGGLIGLVLVFFAFRAAIGIIETVSTGDPFIIDNAKRLTRIGWLLLALNAVDVLTSAIVSEITPANLPAGMSIQAGAEVSPLNILAILFIFVLAQIFQRGSEMREELEETV